MRLQILIIFTFVIIGAIAQRNERRWHRRQVGEEEIVDNHLEGEEKEASSSSEVDTTPEDTPNVQKRRRCKHRHRGGRILPGNNSLVEGDESYVSPPEGTDTANENEGQEKCKRHRHRHGHHHGRHGGAEGHKRNKTHNPEWHERHNISMPYGNSTRKHHHHRTEHNEEWHKAHNVPIPDSNRKHHEHREHTEEWHKAHNISMPDVNRHHHRPHHHHRHHHHHHHNRTTTTTTTTPSLAVERSTWNVNEE